MYPVNELSNNATAYMEGFINCFVHRAKILNRTSYLYKINKQLQLSMFYINTYQ